MPTQTGSYDLKAGKQAHTDASKTATNYITEISTTDGIKVHNLNDTSNYAQINSNGMDVVQGGTSVASFGASARIGKEADTHVEIDSDSLDINDGSTRLASFSDDIYLGKNEFNTGNVKISSEGLFVGTIPNIAPKRFEQNGEFGVIIPNVGVATSWYVGTTLDTELNITLPYSPSNNTSVDFYYTTNGLNSILWHSFSVGQSASYTTGTGTMVYDGDSTFSYTPEEGFYTESAFTEIQYYTVPSESDWGAYLKVGERLSHQIPVANTITVGKYLQANTKYQLVLGQYNTNKSRNAIEIGDGASLVNTHNIFEVGRDGKVYTSGHATHIGYRNSSNGTKSLASSNTPAQINATAVSVTAGTWMLIGAIDFPYTSNAASVAGVRHIAWYQGSTLISGSRVTVPAYASTQGFNTRLQSITTVSVDQSTSFNIYGFQNSGSTMTVNFYWQIVRIC